MPFSSVTADTLRRGPNWPGYPPASKAASVTPGQATASSCSQHETLTPASTVSEMPVSLTEVFAGTRVSSTSGGCSTTSRRKTPWLATLKLRECVEYPLHSSGVPVPFHPRSSMESFHDGAQVSDELGVVECENGRSDRCCSAHGRCRQCCR